MLEGQLTMTHPILKTLVDTVMANKHVFLWNYQEQENHNYKDEDQELPHLYRVQAFVSFLKNNKAGFDNYMFFFISDNFCNNTILQIKAST